MSRLIKHIDVVKILTAHHTSARRGRALIRTATGDQLKLILEIVGNTLNGTIPIKRHYLDALKAHKWTYKTLWADPAHLDDKRASMLKSYQALTVLLRSAGESLKLHTDSGDSADDDDGDGYNTCEYEEGSLEETAREEPEYTRRSGCDYTEKGRQSRQRQGQGSLKRKNADSQSCTQGCPCVDNWRSAHPPGYRARTSIDVSGIIDRSGRTSRTGSGLCDRCKRCKCRERSAGPAKRHHNSAAPPCRYETYDDDDEDEEGEEEEGEEEEEQGEFRPSSDESEGGRVGKGKVEEEEGEGERCDESAENRDVYTDSESSETR